MDNSSKRSNAIFATSASSLSIIAAALSFLHNFVTTSRKRRLQRNPSTHLALGPWASPAVASARLRRGFSEASAGLRRGFGEASAGLRRRFGEASAGLRRRFVAGFSPNQVFAEPVFRRTRFATEPGKKFRGTNFRAEGPKNVSESVSPNQVFRRTSFFAEPNV